MDLHRLRALHAVGAHGSVNAAAQALHVTASAVSQQLAKLQQEVGQPLLRPVGRGVRLTGAGELLASHAERILSAIAEAEADLEAHRDEVVGSLTVAAFATAARALAPAALRALRDDHTQLHVELREMEPNEALPLVVRGDIDLAVVDDWFNAPLVVPDGVAHERLLDDVADVALPADHPVAARRSVDLNALDRQEWITWPRGSICHDWLAHTLREQAIELRVAHTAMEHATQLALVAAGLGAAVVPRLGRGPVPEGVAMLPVTPSLTRHVSMVWRQEAARRPAIHAIVGALRAVAAEHSGRAAAAPRRGGRRSLTSGRA